MLRPQLSLHISVFCLCFLFAVSSQAQQRKAVTFSQQVQQQRDQQPGAPLAIGKVDYRILTQFVFANANPKDLNDAREDFLNDGTGTTRGGFYNLTGFSVGIAYQISSGFLGLEFGRVIETLSATPILFPTPAGTVKESFEIETIYLTHDWVFQDVAKHSFEVGGGIGYASQFKLREQLSGTDQTIIWQANPLAAQVRFSYSFHFSQHVRFRTNIGYEYIAPTELKASEDYSNITLYGTPLTSGRTLQNSSGPVNVDFSGVRAAAGIVVAF
jgi:hypothetical protein